MRKTKKFNVESKIRSALRRIWMYSPERKEALRKAQVRGLKLWVCASCKKPHIKEQVHVDHVEACGESSIGNFDTFIRRLFQGELQILCTSCHGAKSKLDKKFMQ